MPEINLDELSDHDALMFAMGQYVFTVANADIMLSQIMAEMLNLNGATVEFLWRDVGFRTKTKALRRAGLEHFGRDDSRFETLNNILNRLEARSNYRNDLVHGAFEADKEGLYAGRAGGSFKEALIGLKPIDHKMVLAEFGHFSSIVAELSLFVSSSWRTP